MNKDMFTQLNVAQKQAVDTIDGPVLVIAGPGTGKTQLLALRTANILLKTDVLPQNILCLTFTESAARNMRDRLSRFIGKQAYDVRMSTYHGFGSEIIRSYRDYFDDDSADTPIDAIGQNEIMHQIYDELPASNILWRKEVYLKDTLSFISEAKRSLLQPDDIRIIALDNQRAIQNVNKLTKKHLKFTKISKNVAPMFESLFIDMNTIQAQCKLPRSILPLDNLATTNLAEALVANRETGKTQPLTAYKTKWLTKDSQNNWVLQGAKEAIKMLAAADIYDLYLKKLKAANLFDYDDMILRAIKAIKQNDELRFSLQEQYQYIMLDEFQDTNLAQLELIELLTNNPASEGQPNVMAVGDDDQAIFSFQGADLTNMIRFSHMYKNVIIIALTDNWRSHSDILSTSQYISEQIEERLHAKLGLASKAIVAKNPNLPKQATIIRQDFLSDIAEIDWISKEVAKLVERGTPASEIAVIAPKHKYLEPLVPFLQNNGIPIRYDKRENVLEDPNILDLINAAKLVVALQNGDQSLANSLWPSVLSGNEWQLSTSTIWEISWQSEKNRFIEDADTSWQALMMKDDTLRPIALFFTKLALIAGDETLETTLDYLVGVMPLTINEPSLKEYTAPYFSYHFGPSNQNQQPILFNQLLSNLTVLRQKLRGYKANQDAALKITDLLDFVNSYNNANEKLLNTSPYHANKEAVQLLTAYSAKGLEFEAVFVMCALDDVWGMKARGATNNISLPQNLKIIRAAGSTKDEKKRLFYVALTRAKHSLFITSFKQNYAGKQTTSLEFLDESEDNGITTSKALPASVSLVVSSQEEPPTLRAVSNFWQNRHLNDATQPKFKDIIMPRLDDFQLSATHLNSFTDLVYGGPDQFLINTILKFPKSPSADGQFGNAVHETIDYIHLYLKKHKSMPELEQIEQAYTKNLKAKKLSKNDYQRLVGRGKEAFDAFMPQWWPNFSPTNESEESFRHEGVIIGDAHLTGNLDHLLIDHEQQSLIIVDFKTGKGKDKWSNDVKMHKYKQQLLFYKLLIEGSHSYKKYSAEQAKLVFVEPNEEGEIIELSLDYQTEDLDRTKGLINAVWHRIKALDLPDVSDFSKDYKGIIAFEDWLIANSE